MFRTKQIAIVVMLGLALVLTTAAVYTQSAFALAVRNTGDVPGGNGVNGGGGQTPPGLGVASGTPAVNHNPNLGAGGGATGGAPAQDPYGPCPDCMRCCHIAGGVRG